MTRATPATTVSRAAVMAAVAIFFAYVDFHLTESGLLSPASTYIFLWALAGWAAIVAAQCLASPVMAREVVALYANHVGVLGALLAIVICSCLFALMPTAYWNDGVMYLLYPPYDAIVVVLSMLLAVHGVHRRVFRVYLLGAFVLFAGSVLYDALYPGTFSLVPDRAAGFAENPNTAAFILMLLCISIADFDRFRVADCAAWALTAVGVFLTLSRGGAILFLVGFGFYAYRTIRVNAARPAHLIKGGAALAAMVAAVVVSGVFLVQRADMFALSFQPRLGMIDGESQLVTEDDDRIEALKTAVDLVKRSPVVGYGTGYSYSLSDVTPHNMYLQQWINNGLPGLVAYLFLLGASARTFWKRRYTRGVLFVALVAINGMFSHNILEERAFLGLLGILLTCSFYERYPAIASRIARSRFQSVVS
jgi:O-antigen ligase